MSDCVLLRQKQKLDTGRQVPSSLDHLKPYIYICCHVCGKYSPPMCSEGQGSDNGTLGGWEVDGLDASSQGFLQVPLDVTAGAIWRRVIQQLFKWLKLNQDHHVLQEVALYIGCQVWSIKKLKQRVKKKRLLRLKHFHKQIFRKLQLNVPAKVPFSQHFNQKKHNKWHNNTFTCNTATFAAVLFSSINVCVFIL